jgi:hypothetical protein
MQPFQQIVSPSSASTMGWAPASERSMIFSRRRPSATRPCDHTPEPSGPRRAIVPVMVATAATSGAWSSSRTSPVAPHIDPVHPVCRFHGTPLSIGLSALTPVQELSMPRYFPAEDINTASFSEVCALRSDHIVSTAKPFTRRGNGRRLPTTARRVREPRPRRRYVVPNAEMPRRRTSKIATAVAPQTNPKVKIVRVRRLFLRMATAPRKPDAPATRATAASSGRRCVVPAACIGRSNTGCSDPGMLGCDSLPNR